MKRTIKSIDEKHRLTTLDFVERVFAEHESAEEGRAVRALTEEIRSKEYYLPELELIMTDDNDAVIGYALFSRFPLEGRYENELLMLGPVAVKTELQRQHISKELIEYGFDQAKKLGYTALIVEGDPKNYHARGFATSANYGIIANSTVQLPDERCLMVKELAPHALEHISGTVDYSFYNSLTE